MKLKVFALSICSLLGSTLYAQQVFATSLNFDEAVHTHLSDITNFYSGVQFNGISNPFPIGSGAYPTTLTVPTITGGAAIWSPGLNAPGQSGDNFAVGLDKLDKTLQGGDPGILMTFNSIISSISLTGLDFGNNPNDIEQMTLAAYDINGDLIGSQHFTTQFINGAMHGSLAFNGMKYVAFNYTNTQHGFYGIDDLEYSAVPVPAAVWFLGSGLVGLVGIRRKQTFQS